MICQDLCRMVRALCRVQYLKKFGNLSVVLGNGGRKLLCRFFFQTCVASPTQFLMKNMSWNIQVLWKVVESRKKFSVNISRSGWQNSVGSECVRDGSCNVLLKDKASHTGNMWAHSFESKSLKIWIYMFNIGRWFAVMWFERPELFFESFDCSWWC